MSLPEKLRTMPTTPRWWSKLRKAADNLAYVYGMEMIHGCQAIDLRMRKSSIRLGKGTEAAWRLSGGKFLYENDRPISPDIQKAYEFIKSNVLLSKSNTNRPRQQEYFRKIILRRPHKTGNLLRCGLLTFVQNKQKYTELC